MTTIQTTRHATRAEFVAHIARLAAQGFQFDASNVSDDNNTTFQPFVIAYKGAETVYLRFNAMTEGTHEMRRTHAFAAAAELIAEGRAEMANAVADYHAVTEPAKPAPTAPEAGNKITAPKIAGKGRDNRQMLIMSMEIHCFHHIKRRHEKAAQTMAEKVLTEYDETASPHDYENWLLASALLAKFRAELAEMP